MSIFRLVSALVVCFALGGGALVAQTTDGDHVEVLTPPKDAPPPPPAPDLAKVAERVVARANQFRKDQGRPAVTAQPKLNQAVQAFADYMARTLRYGHTADGKKPAERVTAAEYEFCLVAENIAYAYRTTAFTVEELAATFADSWEKSQGHRKNLLDPDVTEIGVAVARAPESGYFFAVQLFARPKALAIEFRISNPTGEAVRYRVDERSYDLPPRLIRSHQTCRPPAVALLVLDGDKEKDGPAVRPKGGERYVVRRDADGKLGLAGE